MEDDKKEISATEESQLQDIREAFTGFYPFLMIEFFQHEQAPLVHKVAKRVADKDLKVCAEPKAVHTIDMSSRRTVSEVVKDVTSLFRVKAQVCRKSGNVWNAVSLTDGWTLERQNTAGEFISRIMGIPPEE